MALDFFSGNFLACIFAFGFQVYCGNLVGNDSDSVMDELGSERGIFGVMDSRTEIFDASGPIHLKIVDWTNIHHQRAVAASLVKGVYVQELDRENNRQENEALAPPWWKFFNFRLCQPPMYDVEDDSICGAIYESESSAFTSGAPRYVIAFRGTGKGETKRQDLKLNFQLIKNGLHKSHRFQQAIRVVHDRVSEVGSSKIWLTGHSLGAAIAMLAGKEMAKNRIHIKAFLFNSPFIGLPMNWIKSGRLDNKIRTTKSYITATSAFVIQKGRHSQASESNNPFDDLSAWDPNLFLNPADWISSGYIKYSEHIKRMIAKGAENIEMLAIQNSLRTLFLNGFRKEPKDPEPLHFLPSANLTINRSPPQTFFSAHGISQWWKPELDLESKVYKYTITTVNETDRSFSDSVHEH